MMTFRERISRMLLSAAAKLDPENKFVCHAGRYKFERGWQQPAHPAAKESPRVNFIRQGSDINGDTGL
jgi:hypothetical protein